MEESRPTPSLVLAAYAQSFVEGRRVVVFGDCTSGLAETLVDPGARLVHVYDGDLSRVTEAAARGSLPNIAYAPLGQSGVVARDGTFDVGIIENLAAADDPAALVTRLRRALAARGVAFIATPNLEVEPVLLADPEHVDKGPSYYELFEVVSAEFSEVRMVGQTPFVGYALAEFGADSTNQFSIDTGFVPGGAEEPEWYLAAAGHFPLQLDAFSVIQMPAQDVLDAGSPAPSLPSVPRAPDREHELQQLKLELEKRDVWASELESRASAADQRADDAESRLETLEAELEALKTTLDEARTQTRQERDQRTRAAQASTKEREQQLADRTKAEESAAAVQKADFEATRAREAELQASRARQAELEAELKRTQTQLERAEATAKQRADETARQRAQDAERAKDAEAAKERDREALENEAKQLREANVDLQSDLDRLEAQLRDRGRAIDAVRLELQKTERLAQELLVELEEARAKLLNGEAGTETPRSPAPSQTSSRVKELEERMAELARVDALRVADLTAAQWTVQELEAKLNEAETSARNELERLRHELQSKSALLEQLRPTPLDA